MIATLPLLHLEGRASAQPGSATDRTGNALPAKHQLSTLP
jgi:hypothetical protein